MLFTTIFSPLKFNIGCKSASAAFRDKITRNTAQACVTFPPPYSRIAGWPISNVYFSLKRSLIACLPLESDINSFSVFLFNGRSSSHAELTVVSVQYGICIGNSLKTEHCSRAFEGPELQSLSYGAWVTEPGLRSLSYGVWVTEPGLRSMGYGALGYGGLGSKSGLVGCYFNLPIFRY